jgi:hypothetical protein
MDYRYSSTNDHARDPEPEYRSIEGLTRWLVGLLIGSAVLNVLAIVSSTMQLTLLSGDYSDEDGAANDAREALVSSAAAVVLILTMIVFAVWIVRAHRNLPGLGGERLDVTPGWALGWFFIPIAWLWKPYKAMRTLWQASHNAPRWDLEDVPFWVPLWWAVWLLSNSADQVVTRLTLGADTYDELVSVTQLSIAVAGIGIVLDGLAMLLVSRIARAQAAQHEARQSARATGLANAGVPALPG